LIYTLLLSRPVDLPHLHSCPTRRSSEFTAVESGHGAAIKAAQALPHLHYRSLAVAFMSAWQQQAVSVPADAVALALRTAAVCDRDRKSTRLNSSHLGISYAVFCLKKNNK